MQFRQLRSSFNDPEDKMLAFDFETGEELFNHDYVKWYRTQPLFTRFSIGGRTSLGDYILMAEYRDGFEWWVVGCINSNLNLPKWEAKFHALLEGKEVVLTGEVVSSCGKELTLRDGRKAENLRP